MKFVLSMGLGISLLASLAQASTSNYTPRVIYGDDNRVEVYQTTDQWKEKSKSTVALMQSSHLTKKGNGYSISTSNYGSMMYLCKNEPFYDQGTAAFCSGSLIAPDIIMTAGHCVRSQDACKDIRFVFNFAYTEKGHDPTQVAADDVYSCKEMMTSLMDSSTMSDFALVRLDRPVVGHQPLQLRTEGAVRVKDGLTLIGHPSGLPTKVAAGASVRDITPGAYFVASTDSYGGNSGSAVLNDEGVVEGILVRGEQDFVYSNQGCYVSNVCAEDGCRGEDVTRVSEVLKFLNGSTTAAPSTSKP